MLTKEQMENLWCKYQREGIDKNLSLQAFCSIHNVPYNQFEKFLKLRRELSAVHPVTITEMPKQKSSSSKTKKVEKPAAPKESQPEECKNRILINIRMTNGIQITKKNMDYQGLRSLVEKLEVLC